MSASKLRNWMHLIRLPAVFTAPSDVLAGVAIASAWGATVEMPTVATLIGASACVYCAGMAANDLADLTVDRQERPNRPLPSGQITKGAAWALVLGLQLVALLLAATVNRTAIIVVLGTIAATYLYNFVVKDGPLGPAAMGACRYGNALLGLSILSPWPLALWLIPLGTAAFVANLIVLSRFEVSGATTEQLRRPVELLLLTALIPIAWPLLGWLPMPWAITGVLLPYLWLTKPLKAALLDPKPVTIRKAVMAGIFAIAMINGVLAAQAGLWWASALCVTLLLPGYWVGRWFYAT